MDGQQGDIAVAGAVLLCVVCLIAIAAISVTGHEIPELFTIITPSLVTFIIGTRVVTSDVTQQIKQDGTPEPPVAPKDGLP